MLQSLIIMVTCVMMVNLECDIYFNAVAVIGFLNTTLTTTEGKNNWLNFSIGVIQGYLDIHVTINFTTEDVTAQGTTNTSLYRLRISYITIFITF